MSDSDTTGFGKFVPGFDFLQSLAQGAAGKSSSMPNFGKWVAPTLDVEELDKRIEELKIVRFWLEQNTNALGATVQALEVQKMTLATLKGMNFNFGETAAQPKAASAAASATAGAKSAKESEPKAEADADAKPAMIDPMQMWGALTQQFQKIAENAVKDASGVAAQATKASAAASKSTATPASKTAPGKTARKTSK